MSYVKVSLIGNLGRDPETRDFDDNSVTSFPIAVNIKQKGKDDTANWYDISVWGKRGKVCEEYLSKGSQVYIEGTLKMETYQDKEGKDRTSLRVTATEVQFLSGGGSAQSGTKESKTKGDVMAGSDDLPF